MGLRVVRCRSVIILVINKLDSRFAVVQFRNHSYDYRPNRTPLSPITIIYYTETRYIFLNYFTYLIQALLLQRAPLAPLPGWAVTTLDQQPLVKNVQQGERVAVVGFQGHAQCRYIRVVVQTPGERRLDTKRCGNDENRLGDVEYRTHEQHFPDHHVNRQLRQHLADGGQLFFLHQGAMLFQKEQRVLDVGSRRRLDERVVPDPTDAQRQHL